MYKRVLLKLSGEALSSPGNSFDPKILASLAKELKQVHELGVDLAIVVGGGNFIRGKMAETMGIERVQADYMGMLATVINALAVQSVRWNRKVFLPVYRQRLKCRRLLNRLLCVVQTVIWKKAVL